MTDLKNEVSEQCQLPQGPSGVRVPGTHSLMRTAEV